MIHLEDGSPPVLHVSGEVDLATGEQLRVSLAEALSAHSALVVDFSGVAFIDAAGLRAVLQAAKAVDGGAPLTLVNAPLVARLLKLTGQTGIPNIAVHESGGRR